MGEIRSVIGTNIKKVCALKGIRQIDIANHLHVSQGSVSNWIKGTNSIDIENLAELCIFLEVSLDQIFGIEPISPDVALSIREKELISYYRSFSSEGQGLLMNTCRAIAGNSSFLKDEKEMSS